jgi:hypothetical protein
MALSRSERKQDYLTRTGCGLHGRDTPVLGSWPTAGAIGWLMTI